MSINLRRELDEYNQNIISDFFFNRNSEELLNILLKQEIFPIKDSYVAYLKRDPKAIGRNPQTVNRLTGMLYDMGIEEIFNNITVPKETNRQIGPLFKRWLDLGTLGCRIAKSENEFMNTYINEDALLNVSDNEMMNFATKYLGYTRRKGLDFIARFNNKYIIGEAKFLSDFGGHQNAQYEDAISTMTSELVLGNYDVRKICILDGVLYIQGKNKMYNRTLEISNDSNIILSSILLRDYLYSI